MNKFIYMTIFVFLFNSVSTLKAQVGINTENPYATLDVTGKPAETTIPDGVISPRISGDQLKGKDAAYTATQTGAIVYVTAPVTTPSAKTVNVTASGYYYFDGTIWQSLKSSGGGFMPTKVNLTSTTDVTSVPDPAEGLVVYSQPFSQLSNNGSTREFPEGLYMYDGTQWLQIVSSNSNTSDLPVRNLTGVLIQVNQSKYIVLSGRTSYGLLMLNQGATINPTYDLGNWSPYTHYPTDVISSTLGEDGAMLREEKDSNILTFWRLNFHFQMGNTPPSLTRYFKIDIVDNESGGIVFSEAVVVPGGLDTGHVAPFSIFFATIADGRTGHMGYKIVFGVDTAASQGLPNQISVELTQILKID